MSSDRFLPSYIYLCALAGLIITSVLWSLGLTSATKTVSHDPSLKLIRKNKKDYKMLENLYYRTNKAKFNVTPLRRESLQKKCPNL